MYASVSTVQIKPGHIATFTQRWTEQIEPAINQLSALVDLYVFVNHETDTMMSISLYASEAEALTCQMSEAYQQPFAQLAGMLVSETLVQTGHTVIST